jgi:hypothetical protein
MVTRLSIESIGALESWTWMGIYILVAILLYASMMIAVRKEAHNF